MRHLYANLKRCLIERLAKCHCLVTCICNVHPSDKASQVRLQVLRSVPISTISSLGAQRTAFRMDLYKLVECITKIVDEGYAISDDRRTFRADLYNVGECR